MESWNKMSKYYQFVLFLGMSIQAVATGLLIQNNSITPTYKQQYVAAISIFFIASILFWAQTVIETLIKKQTKTIE